MKNILIISCIVIFCASLALAGKKEMKPLAIQPAIVASANTSNAKVEKKILVKKAHKKAKLAPAETTAPVAK
jgi:hypothetical protein